MLVCDVDGSNCGSTRNCTSPSGKGRNFHKAHVTIVMADAFKTAYKRSLTSNDAKHLALPYILVTGKDASKATKTEMVNALTSAMNWDLRKYTLNS
jgi:uncharacterized alpha/beta hydrolase family protein